MNFATNPNNLYLTVKQVADRFSVSTDTIYRWRRNGQFPKPVQLSSRTTRWRVSDILKHEGGLNTCFAVSLHLPENFKVAT